MSGTRGNAEGVRGTAQVMLNTKNAPHWARFSFSAGGDRWSSAKHKKRATWARFPCLAGRGGEGRHVGVSGIPVDGGGWREGAGDWEVKAREAGENQKHAPMGVLLVFER